MNKVGNRARPASWNKLQLSIYFPLLILGDCKINKNYLITKDKQSTMAKLMSVMSVNSPWFEWIAQGKKQYEGRRLPPEIKELQVGEFSRNKASHRQ
jgi:hypothetical protein